MLRQAAAARRSIAGLAPQRTSSRLPTAVAGLARQTPASLRRASFLPPWRKQSAKPALPTYFAKARRLPTKQQVGRKVGYVILCGMVYYICAQVYLALVVDPLLDHLSEDVEVVAGPMDEEDEDEDPFIFIPFPFGIYAVKQPPYRASDPEWKAFLKVNNDAKLQREIKQGLADLVRTAFDTAVEKLPNTNISTVVKGEKYEVKRWWLDIIYPRAPPPQHYMTGFIIDQEGVFWGDRPIDSKAAFQVNAAIYPKAMFNTAYAFVDSLLTQTVSDIGSALGFKTTTQTPSVTWQSVAVDRMKDLKPAAPGSKPMTQVSEQPNKASPFSILTDGTLFSAGASSIDMQQSHRLQTAINAASVAFKKNWKPVASQPHRGCLQVDGMLELSSSRAILVINVAAWYDPAQKKYVGVNCKIRNARPPKQKPAPPDSS